MYPPDFDYESCPGSPANPAWKGPFEEGVTQSLLNRFLECPFRAMLYLIYGVEEERPVHPNLVWGQAAHVGLEHLIQTGSLLKAKEAALDELARWPMQEVEFEYSIPRMLELYDTSYLSQGTWAAEKKFSIEHEVEYFPQAVRTVRLRGKIDGLGVNTGHTIRGADCDVLVEHKFKGRIDQETLYCELPVDFQVNLYGFAAGAQYCIYDIIRIPEAATYSKPRRMVTEPVRDYVDRMYAGDCGSCKEFPIKSHLKSWVFRHSFELPSTSCFIHYQLNPLLRKLLRWWDLVTSEDFDPRNPKFYGDVLYLTPIRHFNPSMTEYYHCSYHSLLSGKLDLDELTPVTSFYKELDDDA